MGLVELALAPVLVFLIYIYIRDKYEKEPVGLLLTGLMFGALSTGVVIGLGGLIQRIEPAEGTVGSMIFTAFVASAGVEEAVKYLFLFILVWRNKNFNEPFDGIVYAVFISLGFAGVENLVYVLNPQIGGAETALARAFFSVPGHGLFGVSMGYYLSFAKFEKMGTKGAVLAYVIPWLFHASYNLILLSGAKGYMVVFVIFIIFLWRNAFHKMKVHLENSPFK